MEDKFLQFAYRYKYRDNQYSALSPFSAVAFVPGTYSFDYASGNNDAMLNTKNKVEVSFETGNRFVEEIQVVVRDTKSLNVSIVETFNKNKFDPSIPSYSTHKFTFKNNKVYTVLPPDQVTRLYDNVPIKAKAQEIIDRRLIYGNYTQFYDIANCDGSDLQIDYEVGYLSETTPSGTPIQTFRSDRDYEIAIQYGDDEGRFTTALTPADNENTVYIPPTASVTGNSLQVSINSKAPCFATNYRLMIKESKKSYYNIFPILYYVEGVYRYFLINKSDKDKFKEGDYVIFKSDADGATLSNKKYKILELEVKPKDFLDNNEISGLYFKIKMDTTDFPANDLDVYESTGHGADTSYGLFNNICEGTRNAINDDAAGTMYSYVENPIFYGEGLNDLAVADNNGYLFDADVRFIVEVEQGGTTFRYRIFNGGNTISSYNPTWIETGVSISTSNTTLSLNDGSGLSPAIDVNFGSGNPHTAGDSWRINCRGVGDWSQSEAQGIFGTQLYYLQDHRWAVSVSNLNGNDELGINAGAIIEIDISETMPREDQNSTDSNMVFPPSSRNYVNIEEWFFEEGSYSIFNHYRGDGTNGEAFGVVFRRGRSWEEFPNSADPGAAVNSIYQDNDPYAVRMIIVGYGKAKNTNNCSNSEQNVITTTWKLSQLDNPLLCETEPLEVDDQIFHEIPRTFTITNNEHDVLWRYTDYTSVGSGAVWQGTDYATTYAGKTNIGTLIPGTTATTASDIPHCFQVGDTVWVYSDSTSDGPQGGNNGVAYDVLAVPDNYNIIIDLAFPGSGPVTGGSVSWSDIEQDQSTPTTPAIIKINNPGNPNSTYNAYSFGNGLESDRIRDDFNETELQYSPRATLVIDDYEQETKEAS